MSVFTALLNRTYTIARRARVSDGRGGWRWGYETQGTVQGRLRPASTQEVMTAMQEQRRISHVLYCEHGADVRRADRVSGDSVTVYVEAVREPSRADHHLEVDCTETQVEEAS